MLICQFFFWQKTEKIRPELEIIPTPPSKYFVSAASLGDSEFLFRILASRLQNSGDVFAGFASLKNYDYKRIYAWMNALDELNDQSNFVPALASYYYSQTSNQKDLRYLVDYLELHSAKNLDENWWWLFQAVYIAKNQLNDMDLAIRIANKLAENEPKKAPFWTKQLPAFLYEKVGDGCMAFSIIEKLIKESESGVRQIDPKEMNFMRYFINERLKKLQEQKFDPRACKRS